MNSSFESKATSLARFFPVAGFIMWGMGQPVAAQTPGAATHTELNAMAPSGSHLVLLRESSDAANGDAVAIFETAADGSSTRRRTLVIVRKENGRFQEVDRSDRIIACSTCDQFRGDPFWPGNVRVTPGHIEIVHADSGEKTSTATFELAYDPKPARWRVVKADRTDYAQGQGDATTRNMPIAGTGLLADFDPQWRTPSFWAAVVASEDPRRITLIPSQPDKPSMDSRISDACKGRVDCKLIVSQENGCIAVATDDAGHVYSASSAQKRSTRDVSAKALAACKVEGSESCEINKHYCTTGSQ